ncbi:MAG: hypothetical protein WCS85_03115 [Candidatus Peribacteraceae bacterium]
MKRLFVMSSVLLLLLAGCSSANTAVELRIAPAGQAHKKELLEAAVKVVQGRMEQAGQKMKAVNLTEEESGAVLRFAVADAAVREKLLSDLSEPFSLALMVEAPKEEADIYSELYGGFRETGITEKHVTWATSSETPAGLGTATIGLTKVAETHLGTIYSQNLDSEIALFVRGHLMSRKRITGTDKEGPLQIDNIPSPAVAAVFANDVNVGSFVTFHPLTIGEGTSASSSSTASGSSLSQNP